MTKEQFQEQLLYIFEKFMALLGSQKFWVLLFACLVSYNLPISSEAQALITLIAATVFSGTKAWEDNTKNKAQSQ